MTHDENRMSENDKRCRSVLHIDWDADPVPVREDIAQCILPAGHSREIRHDGTDKHGERCRW